MAINTFYTQWIESRGTELLANDIRALLVTAAYAPRPNIDGIRGDIPESAILAEAVLQNKTFVDGRLKADDVTFVGVGAGASPASVVLLDATQGTLIAVIQTVTGLSAAANGNDAVLSWNADCGIVSL